MTKTLLLIVLSLTLLVSNLSSNEKKHSTQMTSGMKVFKYKMRKGCRSSGIKFSHRHTKAEWTNIYEKEMLRREARVLCPKLDTSTISNAEWATVFTFITDFASDNPKVPSC